jgi:hypothetical protein
MNKFWEFIKRLFHKRELPAQEKPIQQHPITENIIEEPEVIPLPANQSVPYEYPERLMDIVGEEEPVVAPTLERNKKKKDLRKDKFNPKTGQPGSKHF